MTLNTSTHFASAGAQGTDWRDTAKSVLEQLQSIRTEQDEFTFGILYITDDLYEDAGSILTLFKSVTGIENWIGCVGVGVCANGLSFTDGAAIAAMIGKIPEDDFQILPGTSLGQDQVGKVLRPWLSENDAFCTILHGDPDADIEATQEIGQLSEMLQGFIVGGLSSAGRAHFQFANDVFDNGFCGVVFNQNRNIMTGLSQGCQIISKTHKVTRAHDNMIMELDHKPAFDIFAEDLRQYAKIQSPDIDPLQITSGDPESIEAPGHILKGDVHLAFPVRGSDMKDYVVRHVIEMDAEHGWISVGRKVAEGEELVLVRRDADSIQEEFSKMLLNLRKRMQNIGFSRPRAGLYISSLSRTQTPSGQENEKTPTTELDLVREIIGDIPMVGYYSTGEISNAKLYAYTGLLILFN